MKHSDTNNVQRESNTANDHDQLRLLNLCFRVQQDGGKAETRAYSPWIDTKRSIACKKMLTPRASKNTPLKKAPRRVVRCHPKDSAGGAWSRCEALSATSATTKPMRSLSYPLSGQC